MINLNLGAHSETGTTQILIHHNKNQWSKNKISTADHLTTSSSAAPVDPLMIPLWKNLYAATGTDVHLTQANMKTIAEYQPINTTQIELQNRLRSQWPTILARAEEMGSTIPDPVQTVIDLFSGLPGEYNTWREIIEEPYG